MMTQLLSPADSDLSNLPPPEQPPEIPDTSPTIVPEEQPDVLPEPLGPDIPDIPEPKPDVPMPEKSPPLPLNPDTPSLCISCARAALVGERC